uniref:RxLR effector candidate protein n=1 Tax=Hyaloperonospora arabidopsidis (strain Emoy2) TaxID=559515 RepID=M4BSW4_HYAAE
MPFVLFCLSWLLRTRILPWSCRRQRIRCTSHPPRCVMQLRESSARQLIGSLFMLFIRARNECCTAGTKGTSHNNSTVPTRSLAQVETEGRTRPTSVFLDGNGLTDIGVIDSAAATFSTNRSFSPRVRSFENSVGLIKENVAGLPQEPDVLRGMIFALSTTRGRG